MHRVMIHPASYDSCRDAVDRAFEIFPQEIAQKKVVIKPNVLRTSTAEEHIVTHPPLLRAVVEKVEEMSPAEIVVGDNPGLFNYGDNENSFEKTGLMDAAKGYYRNLGNITQHVAFNPDFMPEVGISKEILDADIIISLPKFKTHGLTVMTGAIKNSYGILPGAQKARLHQIAGTPERFHDVIVEVFRLRVPDFFIMDAVVGMEGNGPASPELREIGLILAADNAVAMDGVVARMMGLDPARLRFLQKAKAMGLGDFDSQMIQIDGEMRILSDFKLPPLGGEAIFGNPEVQELMKIRTLVRPQADPELCTACGDCMVTV
ncbi:DUF362 domain-containing protein [Desulfobacula sp.]|uniref:DUF362 domain-containing protein n=1 Tax=Desulfobacula sp. TaxID=2593537 RepID=UPI0026299BDB|nr:DUF362 domain-containing protein [Desulfobacula sp.]